MSQATDLTIDANALAKVPRKHLHYLVESRAELLAACEAALDRHNYQGTGEPWPSLFETLRAAVEKARGA